MLCSNINFICKKNLRFLLESKEVGIYCHLFLILFYCGTVAHYVSQAGLSGVG